MLALLAYPFHFLHKALLILRHNPDEKHGRFHTWAGMRNGREYEIVTTPKLWGKDEWVLDGGKVVTSREIDCILDRGNFGY